MLVCGKVYSSISVSWRILPLGGFLFAVRLRVDVVAKSCWFVVRYVSVLPP